MTQKSLKNEVIEYIASCGNTSEAACVVVRDSAGSRFAQYYGINMDMGDLNQPQGREIMRKDLKNIAAALDQRDNLIFAQNHQGEFLFGRPKFLSQIKIDVDIQKNWQLCSRTVYDSYDSVKYNALFLSDGQDLYYTKLIGNKAQPVKKIITFPQGAKGLQIVENFFDLGDNAVIGFKVFVTLQSNQIQQVSFEVNNLGVLVPDTVKMECVAHCIPPTTQNLSTTSSTSIPSESTPTQIFTTPQTSAIISSKATASTTKWCSSTTQANTTTTDVMTTPSTAQASGLTAGGIAGFVVGLFVLGTCILCYCTNKAKKARLQERTSSDNSLLHSNRNTLQLADGPSTSLINTQYRSTDHQFESNV